ncbi:unnamed protein product [Lymnaea stagnalis]|uniref:TGF-beta family profile domain-containing protein n=1 Tax=Lymnaea stagnalis TaxID=6523 RepID=A0AAV2I2L8_LYMST
MLSMQFAIVIWAICFAVLETTKTSPRDKSRSSVTSDGRELNDEPQTYTALAEEPSHGLARQGTRREEILSLPSRRSADHANSSFISTELNATTEHEHQTGESNNVTTDGVREREPGSASHRDHSRINVTHPFQGSAHVKEQATVASAAAPTLPAEALDQPSAQNVSEEETRSKVYTEKVMTEVGHLEMTKSLNRPPWLVTKFHEKDKPENEAVTHNKSMPAPSRAVLTGDDLENKRNGSTWSYQNYTHVTSLPGSDDVSGNISKTPESGGSYTQDEVLPATTRLVQTQTFATRSTSVTPETKDKRRRMFPDKGKYTSPSKVTPKEKPVREKLRAQTDSPGRQDDKDKNALPTTSHAAYTNTRAEDAKAPDMENGDCPTCGNQGMTEDEVKELRLSMFTDLLLQKLRMSPEDLTQRSEKPIPKLPDEVFEQKFKDKRWDDVPEDFYARDEEVIITGEDMGRNCIKKDSTGCYSFDLQDKVKNTGIASAHLWFYKAKDRADVSGQTFIVYELGLARSGLLQEKSQIARKELQTMGDWVNINVTRYVTSWLEKRTANQMLAVRCKTCATRNYKALYGAKHGYKPILVIKYLKGFYDVRKKRTETRTCNPQTECCKGNLTADFEALNMHNILQPKTLSVGYCYGYCDGIDQFTYNHTSIKQRIRWLHSTESSMREQLKPCCVPLILKDTFIMTYENEKIVTKILPKVIVEKCGCM